MNFLYRHQMALLIAFFACVAAVAVTAVATMPLKEFYDTVPRCKANASRCALTADGVWVPKSFMSALRTEQQTKATPIYQMKVHAYHAPKNTDVPDSQLLNPPKRHRDDDGAGMCMGGTGISMSC